MNAVEHRRAPKTPHEQAGFHLDIGRIEPSHITNLHKPATQLSSAEITSRHSASVGANGFSQSTGLRASMQASTRSL